MEEGDHGVRQQVSFFRGCAPGKEPEPWGTCHRLCAVLGFNSFCLQLSVSFGNPCIIPSHPGTQNRERAGDERSKSGHSGCSNTLHEGCCMVQKTQWLRFCKYLENQSGPRDLLLRGSCPQTAFKEGGPETRPKSLRGY